MKLLACTLALVACRALAESSKEGPHVAGPHGLSGWTMSSIIEGVENQGPLPVELVIAQNGHILRRIQGSPFVWHWTFLQNGTLIAYEDGPLHFALTCYLIRLSSGRLLASYDCLNVGDHAPAWVRQLEQAAAAKPESR